MNTNAEAFQTSHFINIRARECGKGSARLPAGAESIILNASVGVSILRKTTILLAPLLVAACLAQEAKRPPITGVAHISLFVHDIEQSRHFYKDWLG
jgi:hypothetical protein